MSSTTQYNVCNVPGCDSTGKRIINGNICAKHYQYRRTHGHYEPQIHVPQELMLSLEWRKWLAAVIDCEGWIGLYKSKKSGKTNYCYWSAVGVGNTNRILIDKLHELTGIGIITGIQPKSYNAKYKYTWMVSRYEDVKNLLYTISPHLILKQAQAELVLSMPPKNAKANAQRYDIKQKMTILNKKGVA